jgi:surface antigen
MRRTAPIGTTRVIAAILLCGSAASCAPQYATPEQAAANACSALGPRALSGALIGGLGGAAGGAAIGAAAGGGRGAAIGAAAGLLVGIIGGLSMGHQLDQNDCAQARIALQQAGTSAVGYVAYWNSPTGSHGTFTPLGDTFTQNGRVCRSIRSDFQIQGRQPVQDVGVTCRTDSGDWFRMDSVAG